MTNSRDRAPQQGTAFPAVLAGFLGWTIDAFDFFVVVFLIDNLAHQFAVSKSEIVRTLAITLAMRPFGAFVFGLLADRYGRRIPLMVNMLYLCLIELLCGFSPNYEFFLVTRALFGFGMGGVWGVGSSLALEAIPIRWRGILSGVLQSGYSIGYLLAAAASRFLLPAWGWRTMFWAGAVAGLLAFYIRSNVRDSEAWNRSRAASVRGILLLAIGEWKRVAYLIILMTFMMFLSHGTQDLYPDFLQDVHHVPSAVRANVAMLYNLGAVAGAIAFGHLSQLIGRRRSMVTALGLSMVALPMWAFGSKLSVLTTGAVLMQMGVAGAWGVIPIHLNELSADAARGLLPGLTYQLGVLLASPTNSILYVLRLRAGYRWAMAGFEIATIIAIALLLFLGHEAHSRRFIQIENPGAF